MIAVNCYNCGSNKKSFYAEENGFTLVKCGGCGLLYVTPRPDAQDIRSAHLYGMHEGEVTLNTTGKYSSSRSKAYHSILSDLFNGELKEKERTWLDIGCGQGEFLMALERFSDGKVVTKGIEPNIYKRKSAQKKGLDVIYSDIAECQETYDVISLLNVYSHLPNPPEFINTCSRLLNQGGEMLIQTGDVAHLLPEEMYRPMLLPDHLSFTSQEILSNILKKCGFDIIAIMKYPVVPLRPMRVIREVVKWIHPQKKSMIKCLLNSRYNTDMYIRARLLK